MQTFKRKRTLNSLKKECRRRGWPLHTDKFDDGSSDFVRIEFTVGRTSGNALVSGFNGSIFGELKSGRPFSDRESKDENKPWFKSLLACCYVA